MIPLLIIVLILSFLLLVPLTFQIAYHETLIVRVGLFFPFFKIVPRKAKKKRSPKRKQDMNKKAKKGQEKEGEQRKKGSAKSVLELVRKLLTQRSRMLVVRHLTLSVQLGGSDPGDLALTYGGLSALVETAWELLSPKRPERWSVQIIPDFERTKTQVDGELCIATNLMRIASVLISLAFHVILSNKDVKGDLKNG